MITYIVAVYFGKRRSKLYNRCWDIDIYFLVKKHLEQLNKLKVPEIGKIIFVVNHFNHTVDQNILKIINEANSKIPVEVMFRSNDQLSYGAWNEAIIQHLDTQTDYFFLIEDDYIPVTDEFYKVFIDQIDETTGYVSQLMTYDADPIHSAIANGVISSNVAKKIYKDTNSIFDFIETKNINDVYIDQGRTQIVFLEHLNKAGYKLKDISKLTSIPFLESFLESPSESQTPDKIKYFGDTSKPVVLEPAQTIHNMFSFSLITEQDIPYINSIRNKYSNTYLHDSRTFTNEEALQWYKKTKPTFYIINYLSVKIGYFRTSNYDINNKHLCIGCDISPQFTNQGLGHLAYKAFLEFIFRELDLNKVYLEVLATNKRAIHLYEKLGFILEGTKREEVLKESGYVDSIIYSMLKKEFIELLKN